MHLDKFLSKAYTARTETVPVPELADYFDDGEPAVWEIRGLTAAELAKTKNANDKAETFRALLGAMANNEEKTEGIAKALGILDEDVPEDINRRIESLIIGSLNPVIEPGMRDVIVKLSETHPVVFYNLSNKIDSLTGQGHEPGKRKPSGQTR